MRNLQKVLPPQQDGTYHAVATVRFYTSVQLVLQLLARNVYLVGTIQTNKKGFPPALIAKEASRPADVPRGTTTIAVAKCCPLLQAMQWWDRLPVYLLSTGASTAVETCGRHVPGGRRVTIPCSSAMRDYHRWMGGVDIHDQLRLQRYSLQLSVRFRKYYKTIFLGLVDMAMVNAYIVYREAHKQQGKPPADHAAFLEVLQAQLLQTTGADFVEDILSPGPATPTRHATPIAAAHKLSEFPEWVQVREGFRKRPQHQCKVCSIRKTKVGQRSATRFFYEACSNGNKRVYLCDRVRPGHYVNNNMTCHQIWHVKWKNGEERPRPRIGRDIQIRGLGKKRRRREDAETNDDSEPEELEAVEEAPVEEETAPAVQEESAPAVGDAPAVEETAPAVQEETVPAVEVPAYEEAAPATTAPDGEERVNSV
ncbi:hypothetical protein PR001_g25154 [Phytophthora rubi]|nr:hypothetical protein PR001_g25154 [Phytophthora rubi]